MDLELRINVCKNNIYEMNNFINQYKPFIASVVQKHVGRFVEYGRDDELSVGLIAFEEAIRSYNNEKGAFLPFAENVIKRRLIDYFRKEARHNNVIPLSSFYNQSEEKEVDVTEKESIVEYAQSQENEYRRYEIVEIQKELKAFGMSFSELAEASPKHEETKRIYKQIINSVINNSELIDIIKVKKYFPVADIEKATGIHRKKIERSRKYVIAMVIILTGEYKYVQSFIGWRWKVWKH